MFQYCPPPIFLLIFSLIIPFRHHGFSPVQKSVSTHCTNISFPSSISARIGSNDMAGPANVNGMPRVGAIQQASNLGMGLALVLKIDTRGKYNLYKPTAAARPATTPQKLHNSDPKTLERNSDPKRVLAPHRFKPQVHWLSYLQKHKNEDPKHSINPQNSVSISHNDFLHLAVLC
ncbi:hypothetical protein Vadar_015090 [Vaccinium darrowii]|uniref:Uncharacterized protein n=1 Tax=Vaccinium darrowii TaxID=229202 RepID=A0ACB7X0Z8_9ERIC|nr:hypothetical protein Vadar_015090 [Vaccinium darrowii]